MVVRFILVAYTLLRFEAMILKKDWSITQQTIVASVDEIKQPKPFDQLTNISMALQIS